MSPLLLTQSHERSAKCKEVVCKRSRRYPKRHLVGVVPLVSYNVRIIKLLFSVSLIFYSSSLALASLLPCLSARGGQGRHPGIVCCLANSQRSLTWLMSAEDDGVLLQYTPARRCRLGGGGAPPCCSLCQVPVEHEHEYEYESRTSFSMQRQRQQRRLTV